jgi:parallel beta-helix repeat protein
MKVKRKIFLSIALILSLHFALWLSIEIPIGQRNLPSEIESLKSSQWEEDYIFVNFDNWSGYIGEPWFHLGDGTANNPHRIENLTIDAKFLYTGVRIQLSEEPFIIRNCTIKNAPNSEVGIDLGYNTHNGTIINNTICDCEGQGIHCGSDSNKITILSNKVYNVSTGVRVDYSSFINITNNRIFDTTWSGITIWYDNYNITIYNNTIYNNQAGGAGMGIAFYRTFNNTVSNNIIKENNEGIYLTINSNESRGVCIESNCYNNEFYGNIIDNPDVYFQNALDNGNSTMWDNGIYGNYWDDYSGTDINDDGIGDTVYLIEGTAGSQDNYPLWDDGFDRIYINGIASYKYARNWLWAENQPWCSGSGDILDPYVIQDVIIDCVGIGSGIFIENSENVYFTIENCTVLNAEASGGNAGIKLNFANNGTIKDNNCTDNYVGIHLTHCENNTVMENDVINNNGQGIILYQSINNTIKKNVVNGSRYYGIFLNGGSNNNTIVENECYHNTGVSSYGDGIRISYSDFNEVRSNILKYNDKGIMLIDGADYNTIIDNIISYNSLYGALLIPNPRVPSQNQFINNGFDNPSGINAYDNGTINLWDNGIIGNYWGDYIGEDLDDDGIGDVEYIIEGTAGSQDNYPLWDDGDSINPTIDLNSPLGGSNFSSDAPQFNITIFELNLDKAWYIINNSAMKYFFTPINGINLIHINETIWDSLPEGNLLISFFVNDTSGHTANIQVNIIKELSTGDTPKSKTIPFGNLYLLFLSISIISLIAVKRKKQ